ncbi:hypothetical protein GGI23_000320 [Coemansia sp. RSA 2559]|nr:hypothetical protein GGI23_000320 [Coemansia sp. RSA 2559]KAJ2869437.1 hypothetical protein GGI22_000263 [Coemansia erecta]
MTSGSQDASGNSAVSAAAAAAVAVAAAAAAAAGTPISNSTHWSTEETKLLIKTWGEHRDEFAEIKRNLSVWNKVLERLLTAGFFRTVEQCRNRWKFLETKYRTAFKEIDEKGRTTWEFFEDMDMAKRGIDSPQLSDHKPSKRYALDGSPSSQKARRLSPMGASEHAPPLFTDSLGRMHLPPIRASSNTSTSFSHAPGSQREPSPLLHPSYRPQPPHLHSQQQQQQQQMPAPPMQGGAPLGRQPSAMPAAPRSPARPMHPYAAHAARTLPFHSTPPSRSIPASLRTSYAPPPHQLHRHVRTSSADGMRPEYTHDACPPPRTMPEDMYVRPIRPHSDAAAAAFAAIDDPHDRDHFSARKRNRPMHRNSLTSTDHTLDDSSMPVLPPGIDRVELAGTVRRADLLEFLRELSKLREHREAIRIEERKRYEELCSTEEWRFHEFQMSLVNMAQSSLAPHAVDSDSGDDINKASPCESKIHRHAASSVASSLSPRGPSTSTARGMPFVAEPTGDYTQATSSASRASNHSAAAAAAGGGASEEGEAIDDELVIRSRIRTPPSSFSTAHLSAAIARAGARSTLRRTGSSDAEMGSNNRHISSTSSSPLEVRPTKA